MLHPQKRCTIGFRLIFTLILYPEVGTLPYLSMYHINFGACVNLFNSLAVMQILFDISEVIEWWDKTRQNETITSAFQHIHVTGLTCHKSKQCVSAL